ncbi:hypothetical protein [Pseudoramibacter alactolyticus]|uniref:hypothetical protein n=1 Tax=Pseudoramibacter alactolyticus TaxID=113287 RepID=UPI00248DB231|nr:hypothetical protein [Pseudoramibacter alactolyticus]
MLNTGKDPEAIRDYAACISGIVDFFETNNMVTIDMLDFEEPFKQSLRADKRMIETIMKTEIEKIKLIITFVIYCYCRFIGLKNHSVVYVLV